MHRLVNEPDGTTTLYIGARNWPTPIPLVHNVNGWYFETEAGKREILYRRIGRNELGAIAVCEGYVQSQVDYAAKGHDGNSTGLYAQQFLSDTGKQNGLYWAVEKGQPQSPMGPLVAGAAIEKSLRQSAGAPAPYYGYLYKILTEQGPEASGGAKSYLVDGKLTDGFALIAYPTQYRYSGVMTFIVNQDGVVYQQDLGEQTSDLAPKITAYNPGSSWEPAQH